MTSLYQFIHVPLKIAAIGLQLVCIRLLRNLTQKSVRLSIHSRLQNTLNNLLQIVKEELVCQFQQRNGPVHSIMSMFIAINIV